MTVDRKNLIKIREAMSINEVEQFSARVAEHILEYVEDHPKLRHILCFYPKENEVNLLSAYEELSGRYRLYFPVTGEEEIEFYLVDEFGEEAFRRGRFEIMEPSDLKSSFDELPPSEDECTLAIVPGLAFSANMGRMGYGRGYYDRFLARHEKITKCGVCYDFQLLEYLEQKETDVAMNLVTTNHGIYEG